MPVFGVRVSVTCHHIFVHIILSSVWVAEWPPFGKELLTRLTIYCLPSLTICNFSYFPFWFLGRDLGLIDQFLVIAYLLLSRDVAHIYGILTLVAKVPTVNSNAKCSRFGVYFINVKIHLNAV